MIRYWLVAVLAFLSLGLSACGGGGEETATPVPTEELASPSAGTPAAGTPAAGYTVTGNLFESQAHGFQVSFPEGWTPRGNFLSAPGLAVDAFFATDIVDGVQPNIAVACEDLPQGMTLQEYFDKKVEVAKQVAGMQPEVGSRKVSDQDAMVSRYQRPNIEAPLEKEEVFFVTERCGWGISLSAPLGRAAEYDGLFEEFLDSFRLQ